MFKKTYKCDDCGVSVTVYVPITETPTHPCKRHANKTRKLDEVETRHRQRGQDFSGESD